MTTLATPTAAPSAAQAARKRRAVRRGVRRAFRSPRKVPAVVVAALVAGLALLGLAEVVSRLVNRPLGLLPVAWLTRQGEQTRWEDPAAVTAAVVIAGLGLLVLAVAVWPGRGRAVPLDLGEAGVAAGITRAGLRRIAADAAVNVDGISRATVQVRRRRLRVWAHSPLYDTRGLAEQAEQAVTARVGKLALLAPLPARVTVWRRRERGT